LRSLMEISFKNTWGREGGVKEGRKGGGHKLQADTLLQQSRRRGGTKFDPKHS